MRAPANDVGGGGPDPAIEQVRHLLEKLTQAHLPTKAECLEAQALLDDVDQRLEREEKDRAALEAGLQDVTTALSGIAALNFQQPVARTYDGGPFDVIAYLINETGAEVQQLLAELKRTHEQLLESAKMRALGTLACGVAHDFNNVLTVLMGLGGSIAEHLPPDHWARADLETMMHTCDRSRGLTKQLLTFARADASEPIVFEPATAIVAQRSMLARVVSGSSTFEVTLPEQLWCVRMDPAHFDQMLLNLVGNASKAIERSGTVALRVENVESSALDERGIAGPHVRISVTDDGVGITPKVRARMFEPFFTTRPTGEGTGLGLSTSLGTVRAAGGDITVVSEPGQGTTFTVRLPRAKSKGEEAPVPPPAAARTGRSGVVLVVDDDPTVCEVVSRIASSCGYTVHAATGGRRALEISRSLIPPVDLLVTDIVMPEINGPQLAEAVLTLSPTTKILFMSGYNDQPRETLQISGAAFISKPFRAQALLQAMDTLLDQESL